LKLEYIPQIDGLRAIAVLSVIVYHLNSSWLPGGFYGVDIFFVISGFLITSYIKQELAAGTFSLLDFYKKRIRRLMPAFAIVVLASLIAGYFILPADRYERLGYSSLSALASFSNFFFWQESGYFDVEANIKPLLHTWSLAVEEQFYLLWPITLVILYKHFEKLIFYSLAAIFTASLLFVIIINTKDPNAVFYLLPARAFELSIGAALTYLPRNLSSNIHKEMLVFFGLTIVSFSLVYLHDQLENTVLFALIPCLGAALLIHNQKSKIGTLLLANPLMVTIGRLSYSLYLVHWPLLVYMNYTDHLPTSVSGIAYYLAAVFIFSVLLHLLIEKPIHKNTGWVKSLKITKPAIMVLPLIILPAVSALTVISKDGFLSRYPNDLAKLQNQITRGGSKRANAALCMIDENCNKPETSKIY